MKKDAVLGFIFLSVIAGGLSAAPEPSWFQHKDVSYPDSHFVSAVGTGNTPKDAETDALEKIAYFFKSNVSAQEEFISQYNQALTSNTHNGRKDSKQEDTKKSILKTVVTVTTQAEMWGVRFTAPWYNEPHRHWVVLGYINKQEVRQTYQNRIDTNREVIDALIALGSEEPELLYKHDYFKAAAAVARMIEADCRAMEGVSDISLEDLTQYTRKIVADYNAFRSRLIFDVQIAADRQERIQQKLFEVLEKQGYVTAPNRGIYTIAGTVSTFEEELPAGKFVRAGISLRLVNTEGSLLFSYSRNYPRKGSGNWDTAYSMAFRGIEDDLERNFIREFNAFIGN